MTPPLVDRLPYASDPLPEKWRWLRPAGYALLAIVLVLLILQFQRGTIKALRKAEQAAASGSIEKVKKHRGAIGRWRHDIHAFWSGQNIYLAPLPEGQPDHRPRNQHLSKHPNMPLVIVLLTPFAYLPIPVMALTYNLVKSLALVTTILMAITVVNHGKRRVPDWVAFVGILGAIEFFIGDLQHGNTNVFVALCVVAQLWFFRRGHDRLAGAALAMGICLKLTPALFILYWIYQRQWKVLAATFTALPALILAPALLTGWSFYAESMTTWWNVLIGPSLGGGWYPMHINQSLSAVIGRYFSGGDSGNYLFDPDSSVVPEAWAWITVVDLGENGARTLIRILQVILLGITAWSIGLKRLPRDDARRALHYGALCALMLLLNQRSWDHHATYLIVTHLAIAHAFLLGDLTDRFRKGVFIAWLIAVVGLFLAGGDILKGLFGDSGADRIAAYGTAFWHFLIVWILCILLAVRLRSKTDPCRITEAATPATARS